MATKKKTAKKTTSKTAVAALDKTEELLAKMAKDYPGRIMSLANKSGATTPIEVISTGSLGLDIILSKGGLPRGQIVEVYGNKAMGKTTLCFHLVKEAQQKGIKCGWLDMERTLDMQKDYAADIGVDLSSVIACTPESGEEAVQFLTMLGRDTDLGVIVVDSVAAMVTRNELELADGKEARMAGMARLMNSCMRRVAPVFKKNNVLVVFINQLRANIGSVGQVTTGGAALGFFATVQIMLHPVKGSAIKVADDRIGTRVCARLDKSKMGTPHRSTEYDLLHGIGVSRSGEVIDWGVKHDLVQQSGAWFSIGTEKIGQGRQNAMAYLDEHPEVRDDLYQQIRTIYGI